jgi:ABC-type lipoprotein export system ATPase subunit
MKINIHKESDIELTHRVEMLGSMFDCPINTKLAIDIQADLPIEEKKWNVGLIVGPSGSGKTTILESAFGRPETIRFERHSVIDDFPDSSMESISSVCQSVGFNTIPAWLRPYSVLSTGEKFRVETAVRLLSRGVDDLRPILVDEFTSVVDRQVAQITSLAIGKYVRANGLKFVAASCHYDILEWLQPDWIYDTGRQEFQWRSLHRRPPIGVSISRVPYQTWNIFSKYHYMTNELNKAARCYGLFVSDRIASFLGVLHRPHPRVDDIIGVSRVVTLPDWQGLGLAMCLVDTVASAYKAMGKRFHQYPNHPAMLRSYQRSANWIQIKDSGVFSPRRGATSTVKGFGGKRCGVFLYVGDAMNPKDAKRLIEGQ